MKTSQVSVELCSKVSGHPAALQEGGFLKMFFKFPSLLAHMDNVLDFSQDEE